MTRKLLAITVNDFLTNLKKEYPEVTTLYIFVLLFL